MQYTLVLVVIALASLAVAFEKTYTAKGLVKCHGNPVANQKVEMKYYDKIHKGGVLSARDTDSRGQFTLKASNDTRNFMGNDLKVYLQVDHNCDAQNREGCDIITVIDIPASFEGKVVEYATIELSDQRNQTFNQCDSTDY